MIGNAKISRFDRHANALKSCAAISRRDLFTSLRNIPRIRSQNRRSRVAQQLGMACALFAWWGIALLAAAHAAEPAAEQVGELAPQAEPADDWTSAALVRIRIPLSGGAEILKQSLVAARDHLLDEARRRRDPRRPILVLEIAPATGSAAGGVGSDFERAFALADLVSSREMAGVKTVAWIPQTIRGHGVLLAAACEEIVMAEEAEIGDAGADEPEGRALRRAVVEAYREIADARRTLPAPIAVAMVEPGVELLRVESETGEHFVLADELPEFRAQNEVIDQETLTPAGSLAHFTGREGRRYGFVRYLAGDKSALAQALATRVEFLVEDDALAASWRPVVIDVHGPLTPRSVSEFKTLLSNELSSGQANWVGLRIDSVGGDLASSLELANFLAQLDPNSVRTVAYVPVEARGGAALVALACDQLIMHPEAEIGVGPNQELGVGVDPRRVDRVDRGDRRRPLPPGEPLPDRGLLGDRGRGRQVERLAVERSAAVLSIRESLAPRLDRNWSLLAAMVDPDVELFTYRNKVSGAQRLMSVVEAEEASDAASWVRGEPLVDVNNRLTLNGVDAAARETAWQNVESFEQLQRLYGIETEPRQLEPNWALQLISALASPGFASLLILIGLAGLYIEAKTPGVGLGGIVATVAFVLFFWSKYLDQTANWLEILLFMTGIVFLLIELLVLPGFGVFGLGGALLVIFSLVLASQTFVIPHSPAQLDDLTQSLGTVVGAFVGLLALGILGRRFLPHAPLLNRLILHPAPPEEKILLHSREMLADYGHLVGRPGTAYTDLLPTGKAAIGDELVDVVSEGEPIDRGAKVVVVAAVANRVMVRRAT